MLMLVLIVLFTSCGNEPIRFSILGDSYSTFEGYVSPDTNDVWYHRPPNIDIDVTDVSQMWWWQVADSTGWQLEKNNSFSGSFVCNLNHDGYDVPYSFLRRMDNLGNPDVIFVFGGANDIWDEVLMGKYVYGNWTEKDLCKFKPALACVFDTLKRRHPKAKIYFIADSSLGDDFMEMAHTITGHYGINCIDLAGIDKIWNHPTSKGMASIAQQVLAALRAED